MSILANSNAIESGGYAISNSLRFETTSKYLNRTPASASNRTTYTLSYWVKRGALGTYMATFGAGTSGSDYDGIRFDPSNQLEFFLQGATASYITTTQAFRDPSAWYHFVFSIDTTQATASNRIKIYVNGEQITAFSTVTYPSLNYSCGINNNIAHAIGASSTGGFNTFLDGYMTEINFIDGQALTPSDFGEYDTDTGQWVAKRYTGTYGTNGYYLDFEDGTSTTTLGNDVSGNANNWTLNSFTRSAGVDDCWMVDTPTSNYAVLNHINLIGTGATAWASTSKGNLRGTTSTSIGSGVDGTMAINNSSSDKWYWEIILLSGVTAAANAAEIGVAEKTVVDGIGTGSTIWSYTSSQSPTYTNGDTIGVAYDASISTLYFYKNNVLAKTITSVSSNEAMLPYLRDNLVNIAVVGDFNFGQRSFAYTPPTGFNGLCTANLPEPTIVQGNQHMDATLYTGNGATQSIVNEAGFQPDLVWVKSRSSALNNKLTDSARGVTQGLISNSTGAETTDTTGLTAFNTDGFSLGADATYNTNTASYVGWQWKAGGTAVTNTDGTITSQVSANTDAGFSIATYTGNGTAGATVGHGLGVTPKIVILKRRSVANEWINYLTFIDGTMDYVVFNTTAAKIDSTATLPASSVFSLLSAVSVNASGSTYVAYSFAQIEGFSKFSTYKGNGNADGTFVYTGFKPKFILIKRTDGISDWRIYDSVRSPDNVTNELLNPNLTAVEATSGSDIDILSNGFKMRSTSAGINATNATHMFMAFAENPFKNSNAR
tara:strand:- start:6939 stop:9257 length:2319 start_codon:yes stop_codon:yes gene_type:complete